MQQLYLRWHGRAELKRILRELEERGYRNVNNLTADYSFSAIVVDREKKIFFESHASYMAAHLVTGALKLYEWEDIADVIQ